MPSHSRLLPAVSVVALLLAGCAKDQIDETGGMRITRSACPAVAVPTYTGDITLFDPPASREARAIDVVASITDLRGNCVDNSGSELITEATFRVDARRTSAAGARQIILPYFSTVVRGGSSVISKQIGRVAIDFPDGQLRASATATAGARVSRAAATLPEEVHAQLTRKRKPGDADASIDPMSDPAIRSAVARSSFELLIGFQLSDDQLKYNATR